MSELPITQRYNKSLSPNDVPPEHAPDWIEAIDNPYLHGVFAPTVQEVQSDDLKVEGEIPRDLFGAYFRNGPNSRFAPTNRYHWFDGDGMVHGIWFENGKARYRNRWVQTAGSELELEKDASIWPGVLGPFDFSLPLGPIKDTANTDVLVLDGKLVALWYESGKPCALDLNTLEPIEPESTLAKLPKRISAHSKMDPNTGDFIYFSYGDRAPYMRYGVLRKDGSVHQTDITLPGPRRPHDIGVTANYSILHDFPVFFDPELFKKTGKRIPLFHKDVPTRFGIIPRFGSDSDVRWFECEPCYMLHTVNCWEEGDLIVMIGCRTNDPSLKPNKEDGKIAAMLSGLKLQANLYRWTFNMKTGEVKEGPLDDYNAEFPMFNNAMTGIRSRYSYHQHIPYEVPATFHGICKYDLQTGSRQDFSYGPGVFGSESPFAQRIGGSDEDDGYLLSFVTDTKDWSSACVILNAKDITAGPVAKVHLPHRVPAGFHATWSAGSQ